MKKIISTIISSAIVISSLTTLLANATSDEKNNALSVTTKSISEDLVLSDGNIIPTGSVALTVSIANNTGFDASTTKLDIGNTNVLVDAEGKPIVSKEDLLEKSTVVSVAKDNHIAVSSVLCSNVIEDGDMFTIYLSNLPSSVSVWSINDASVDSVQGNTRDGIYRIGDVNNNGYIDSVDASQVAQAVTLYSGSEYGMLPVSTANTNLSLYFPYIPNAEIADTNLNGIINHIDQMNIMYFYTYLSVGYSMEEATYYAQMDGNYCGQQWIS